MEEDALLPSKEEEKRPSWTTKRGGWILTGVYLFGMVRFARLTVYTPVSYLYPLTTLIILLCLLTFLSISGGHIRSNRRLH